MFHLNRLLIFVLLLLVFSCSGNKKEEIVIMNMCGRGDKDIFAVADHLGVKL